MHPIIYVDGKLADAIGRVTLQQIADIAATASRAPVSLLTHGESEFHAATRITGKPALDEPEA